MNAELFAVQTYLMPDLSVKLTAITGPFTAGVEAARGALGKLTAATAAYRDAASNVASSVGASFSSLARMLTSPLALIGAGGGIAGFAMLIRSTDEAIAATGRLSDRLGITTEKLTGLQYAAKLAGVDADGLTMGLEKMLKNLSESAGKGGTINLGATKIDAKELVNASPEEAFTRIAEGLKNITNPAERAQAAVDLFGKAGQGLLPLMMQGADGIRAAEAEAQRLGLTFSRVDAAKVELANQAFTRMQAVVQGAVQTLAIQLAPFMEAMGNKLTQLATQGGGVAQYITSGFRAVTMAVAYAADGLNLLAAGLQVVRAGASHAFGFMIDIISPVLEGLDKLLVALGKTSTGWSEVSKNLAKGFHDTGTDAWESAKKDYDDAANGKYSKAARSGIDQIQNDSNAEANKVASEASKLNGGAFAGEGGEGSKGLQALRDQLQSIKEYADQGINPKYAEELSKLGLKGEQAQEWVKLKEQIDEANKSYERAAENAKKVEQLRDELDALKSGRDVDAAKLAQENPEAAKLQEQIDLVKKRNEMLKEAQSPIEKFQAALDEINKMYKQGLLSLPQYDELTKKANQDFEKESERDERAKPVDVKAETRRFALDVPQMPQRDDAARRAAQEQKQTDLQTSIESYIEQMYLKFCGLGTGGDDAGNIDDFA